MSDGPTETPLGIPTGFGPSGRTGKGAEPPVTRVRLTFSKERALRYIGHLDVVRMWERAFRRAKLPLAYTLGFTPHPRLTLAAPLALGVTSEAELMDVYLREPLAADEVAARISAQLPAGCRVVAAVALPVEGAALTAQTRWAQYGVLASASGDSAEGVSEGLGSRWAGGAPTNRGGGMHTGELHPPPIADDEVPWRPPEQRLAPPEPERPLPPAAEVEARIADFLAARSVPLTRARDGKMVDVRSGVLSVRLAASPGAELLALEMVLKLDSSGAGRPEDVAASLGLRARSIHRVKIGLEGESPPGLG